MPGKRTKIDAFATEVLREAFKITPLPSKDARKNLAAVLRLTPRNVQVWFQNQRQRLPSQRPLSSAPSQCTTKKTSNVHVPMASARVLEEDKYDNACDANSFCEEYLMCLLFRHKHGCKEVMVQCEEVKTQLKQLLKNKQPVACAAAICWREHTEQTTEPTLWGANRDDILGFFDRVQGASVLGRRVFGCPPDNNKIAKQAA